MTAEERIEWFRRSIRAWIAGVRDRQDSYRKDLVIPKPAYKGLAWGMYWSAARILGDEDPDTRAIGRLYEALSRLDKMQRAAGLV